MLSRWTNLFDRLILFCSLISRDITNVWTVIFRFWDGKNWEHSRCQWCIRLIWSNYVTTKQTISISSQSLQHTPVKLMTFLYLLILQDHLVSWLCLMLRKLISIIIIFFNLNSVSLFILKCFTQTNISNKIRFINCFLQLFTASTIRQTFKVFFARIL